MDYDECTVDAEYARKQIRNYRALVRAKQMFLSWECLLWGLVFSGNIIMMSLFGYGIGGILGQPAEPPLVDYAFGAMVLYFLLTLALVLCGFIIRHILNLPKYD